MPKTKRKAGGHQDGDLKGKPISASRSEMAEVVLPAETNPVQFGVHGAVAEHYKVPADKFPPHATTLDYIIASAAG